MATHAVAPILEMLVAEFAIQALPTPYARAVAATSEPPDLVVAQVCSGSLKAIRTLRSGKHTATVPILALAQDPRPQRLPVTPRHRGPSESFELLADIGQLVRSTVAV